MNKRHKRHRLRRAITALSVFAGVTAYQNLAIQVTQTMVDSQQLPAAFNGFRIVQITDLHGRSFGESQGRLLEKIKELSPDLIVITGDLADSRHYDPKPCLTLAEGLVELAPVYYVYGNHELRLFDDLEGNPFARSLRAHGVWILNTSATRIERGGAFINLAGVQDPSFEGARPDDNMSDMLTRVTTGIEPDEFTILLSHRPEYLSVYAGYPVDLVLAGHAHGGQVRLPLIGGLFAPGQGLFPKYTAGKYTQDHVTMVVSRGLGNSLAPIRVFNPPELSCVTLHTAS